MVELVGKSIPSQTIQMRDSQVTWDGGQAMARKVLEYTPNITATRVGNFGDKSTHQMQEFLVMELPIYSNKDGWYSEKLLPSTILYLDCIPPKSLLTLRIQEELQQALDLSLGRSNRVGLRLRRKK